MKEKFVRLMCCPSCRGELDIKVEKKEELAEELADVAIYLLMLAHELNVDLEKAIPSKLEKNALKYPVSD